MLGHRCVAWASLQRPLSVATLRTAVTVAASEDKTRNREWEEAKPFDSLPGPKPLALIGNIWRALPGGAFHNIVDSRTIHYYFYENFGKISRMVGIPGRRPMCLVYCPEGAEKVYRNEGPWPVRQGLDSLNYYRTVTRKDFFEGAEGLLESQGETWGKFRTTVNQPMMQPRVAKSYITPINEVAEDFIRKIPTLLDEKGELPSNFMNEILKWGLESIAMIALDTRLGCLDDNMTANSEPQMMINNVHSTFDAMFVLVMKLPIWKFISTPTWRTLVKNLDFFREVSMKYINEALERVQSAPPDESRELSVLERILLRDPNPRVACVMALDMLSAGVDTTSNSLAFVLHFLATNPDAQKKLQSEVDHVIPRSTKQSITNEQLNELKYLKACIKESMRLSPIVPGNIRTLTKDLVLLNYRIPKGTDVAIGNQLMCQMEEYFPQADRFIPERWIKGDSTVDHKMTPFVFMPFGFGARMCIGRRFAELELEIMLAKLMQNFTLEWHHGPLETESKLITTVKSPLKFKVIPRTT